METWRGWAFAGVAMAAIIWGAANASLVGTVVAVAVGSLVALLGARFKLRRPLQGSKLIAVAVPAAVLLTAVVRTAIGPPSAGTPVYALAAAGFGALFLVLALLSWVDPEFRL